MGVWLISVIVIASLVAAHFGFLNEPWFEKAFGIRVPPPMFFM